MRKRGQYFKDKRVKFKENFQRDFLLKIKQKSDLSWSKLAKSLNISEHTLKWDLYKEKSTFPYKLLKKILKQYPIETFEKLKEKSIINILDKNWGQKKSGKKFKKKINHPKNSEELGELLGIILGDGHLHNKGLRIVGNALEKYHYDYIAKLIQKLFNLKSRIYISYTNPNTIILNTYSIELVNFLTKNGLKIGNKIIKKSSFPRWIFKNKEFIFASLRGLIDTDGGIYFKQKDYKRAMIEFQTDSSNIRKDIIRLLKKAGFTPSKSSGNIRIQNQKEIDEFFSIVGSSNPKNIIRYIEFKKNKYIPLKEELTEKIINYNGELPFKMQS